MDRQAEDDARLGFAALVALGSIPPALPADHDDDRDHDDEHDDDDAERSE